MAVFQMHKYNNHTEPKNPKNKKLKSSQTKKKKENPTESHLLSIETFQYFGLTIPNAFAIYL